MTDSVIVIRSWAHTQKKRTNINVNDERRHRNVMCDNEAMVYVYVECVFNANRFHKRISIIFYTVNSQYVYVCTK